MLLDDLGSSQGRYFNSPSSLLHTNNFSPPQPRSALRRPYLLFPSRCQKLLVFPLPLPFGFVATGLYGHRMSNVVPKIAAPVVVANRVA